MKFKSFFAGTLAAVTILSFGGGVFAAPTVSAATEAEQQAQIAALLAQIAALQASMSGGSSSCYTFSMDLTLGSESEGVRALQVFLNGKGFLIATAGPGSKGAETTYFGGLTRTALAKYQASVGISPAAGYFGPITRAKVNASCTSTNPGTGTDDDDDDTDNGGDLSGGEADLTDFNLVAGESSGNESESEVDVFTAEFDVEDGDVRIERIEIIASSSSSTLETDPWNFFDSVTIMDGDGDELASMDVDSRDDWDEQNDGVFQLSVTGLDYVVREGDMAEMVVAFDIASNIDTDDQAQDFDFYIDDEGIRARDAAGIDQYIGDDTDTVDFGFGAEENGDLSIQSSTADPDASILVADEDEESDEYTVFAFDIDNDDDVDSLITDITITGSADTSVAVRNATLVVGSDEFDCDVETNDDITCDDIDVVVAGDDEETFRLAITLNSGATGSLSFTQTAVDVEAEGEESGDDADVSGSATSETHTIALNGIAVVAESTDSDTLGQGDTTGEFTIIFEVTAMDEPAYIATTTGETGTPGVEYSIITNSTTTYTSTSSSLTSSADTESGYFVVEEGDTETFTLTVSIDPAAAGTYTVGLDKVRFADTATTTGRTTFEVDENDQDFQAGPQAILQ